LGKPERADPRQVRPRGLDVPIVGEVLFQPKVPAVRLHPHRSSQLVHLHEDVLLFEELNWST
jgi:hypothetical protein